MNFTIKELKLILDSLNFRWNSLYSEDPSIRMIEDEMDEIDKLNTKVEKLLKELVINNL